MAVRNKKEVLKKSNPSIRKKSDDLLLEEYKLKLKNALDIVNDLNNKIDTIIKNKNEISPNTKKVDNIFNDSMPKRKISLSYNFDSMPIDKYYSKYKRILRAACDTTLIGNLEEGLNIFKTMKAQNIPKEYREMIEKNIEDIGFYMKSYYTSID